MLELGLEELFKPEHLKAFRERWATDPKIAGDDGAFKANHLIIVGFDPLGGKWPMPLGHLPPKVVPHVADHQAVAPQFHLCFLLDWHQVRHIRTFLQVLHRALLAQELLLIVLQVHRLQQLVLSGLVLLGEGEFVEGAAALVQMVHALCLLLFRGNVVLQS